MKSISIILILSLLCYSLGCYNTTILRKDSEIIDALENNREISVVTDIIQTYNFTYPEAYQFKNDTIYGRFEVPLKSKVKRYDPVKIAYNDIYYIKVKELNAGLTILTVIGIGGIFAILYGASQFSGGFAPF